MDESTNLNIYQ